MKNNVLLKKMMTEKSAQLEGGHVYVFAIPIDATKYQIAHDFAVLYGVAPKRVRTALRAGKTRRAGKYGRSMQTASRKIAYITTDKAVTQI